jgi:hypothetical protein
MWREWLLTLLVVSLGGTACLYAAVVLLDPFATGRLTPAAHFDVTTEKRMFAHVGRVRNPAFDAAVIGNSRGFALETGRLSAASGRTFTHLTLEAAFADDQLRMARLFAAARAGRPALIVHVVDDATWCSPAKAATAYTMPWWLYEGSNLPYLRNIFSADSLGAAFLRASIMLGFKPRHLRSDGYALWLPRNATELRQDMLRTPRPVNAAAADVPFPNLDDLARALQEFDASVVLFMPPTFAGALPATGSPAEARLAACKRRLAAIAGARPHTAFVDALADRESTRNPNNFIDATHYLDPVAIEVEVGIVAAIKRLAN